MEISIVIAVDNKQEMLNALLGVIDEGDNYADKVLEQFGLMFGSDRVINESVRDGILGHVIGCKKKNECVKSPADYIKWALGGLSDYGLGKWGLTRKEYEAWRLHDKVKNNE